MNVTTTPTLFEEDKDKQIFAEAIIHVVEKQHEDDFLLENIPFGFERPEDINRFNSKIGNLQVIAKMYGKSRKEVENRAVLKGIAEQLFDVFECMGEIKKIGAVSIGFAKMGLYTSI